MSFPAAFMRRSDLGRPMRLRRLAMTLSGLPTHPLASVELEQYSTPGDLAARWLFEILRAGDLEESTGVVDLGAGNGVLGIGAGLLGVARVVLVEAEAEACAVAEEAIASVVESKAIASGVIEVRCATIDQSWSTEWPTDLQADLIIMNPPWGVQTPRADRPFIEAALASQAASIHLMHAAEASHPAAMAADAGWQSEVLVEAEFRLPAAYTHHSKRAVNTPVRCWRFSR